ncbi:MAG: hypothetical protein IJV26_03580 [Lachnospiraceae bacterium]|nr:hypothetical protein [Lachnospiraceae bacterium]
MSTLLDDEFAEIQAEVERRIQETQEELELDYTGSGQGFSNGDVLIRANGLAEEMEKDQLRDEVAEYAHNLRELRDLYEKNSILIERLREMNMETTSSMRDALQELSERMGTPVQVEGLTQDQMRELILSSVQESQEKIGELLKQSDDFNHRENVRVYRNIQASTAQELEKQSKDLTEKIGTVSTGLGTLSGRLDELAGRLTKLEEHEKEQSGLIEKKTGHVRLLPIAIGLLIAVILLQILSLAMQGL